MESSGGSELSENHRMANVTIFDDDNVKRVWAVYESLQQVRHIAFYLLSKARKKEQEIC